MMKITLPFPPSVNSMYLNMRGVGRVKSPAYRVWLTEAGFALKQLPAYATAPFDKPVNVEIDLDNRRRGDADNRIKPILDLLCGHRILLDDSKKHVRRVSIGWEKVIGCLVKITPVKS